MADDIFFAPPLKGPAAASSPQHVLYNWIVPNHAQNPDAAKEFLLHYTANYAHATYNTSCTTSRRSPTRFPSSTRGWATIRSARPRPTSWPS